MNQLNANLVTNERLTATDERIEVGFAKLNESIEQFNSDMIESIDINFAKMNVHFDKMNESMDMGFAKMNESIDKLKVDLIKWMAGMSIAAVLAMGGIVVSLMKFL